MKTLAKNIKANEATTALDTTTPPETDPSVRENMIKVAPRLCYFWTGGYVSDETEGNIFAGCSTSVSKMVVASSLICCSYRVLRTDDPCLV